LQPRPKRLKTVPLQLSLHVQDKNKRNKRVRHDKNFLAKIMGGIHANDPSKIKSNQRRRLRPKYVADVYPIQAGQHLHVLPCSSECI